jgi:hypothetical protein
MINLILQKFPNNTLQLPQLTTRRTFLKGENMEEGGKETFEILSVTIANKQRQKTDGTWEDDTQTVEHYNRETKECVTATVTDVCYQVKMVEIDESIKLPKVFHIHMQSGISVRNFEQILGEKLDKNAPRGSEIEAAIGMEITFERINNVGMNASAIPVV